MIAEGKGFKGMVKRSLLWICGGTLLGLPLLAAAQVPAVTQVSFAPASIASGVNSQLTIVLSNPNAAAATLTAPARWSRRRAPRA